jgi:hypothetical protein
MIKLKEINVPIYDYKIEFVSGYIGEIIDYYRDVDGFVLESDSNHVACT